MGGGAVPINDKNGNKPIKADGQFKTFTLKDTVWRTKY